MMAGGFAVPEPGGAPPEELSEDAIVECVMPVREHLCIRIDCSDPRSGSSAPSG